MLEGKSDLIQLIAVLVILVAILFFAIKMLNLGVIAQNVRDEAEYYGYYGDKKKKEPKKWFKKK